MTTKSGLPPIHPGEFLKETLEELNITQANFARAIGVSRPVTAELALLFSQAFGQSPQYWLNLQTTFDLKTMERKISGRLKNVRKLAHA